MNTYEIIFKERGIVTIETVKARNILSAIGDFYNVSGGREILKIEKTK